MIHAKSDEDNADLEALAAGDWGAALRGPDQLVPAVRHSDVGRALHALRDQVKSVDQ